MRATANKLFEIDDRVCLSELGNPVLGNLVQKLARSSVSVSLKPGFACCSTGSAGQQRCIIAI